MTNVQKSAIEKLRAQGISYAVIANTLGLSRNTVKSYCKRNNLSVETPGKAEGISESLPSFCLECGKVIIQTSGRKKKKFCSDECRLKWWNTHPEKITRKAIYSYTCTGCGKTFAAYGNSHRKYCSHACYITDRFEGDGTNE